MEVNICIKTTSSKLCCSRLFHTATVVATAVAAAIAIAAAFAAAVTIAASVLCFCEIYFVLL